MPNYFTKKGWESFQRKIIAQKHKVWTVGKEVGDAAGISCDWHDNFGYEDAKRRFEMESTILKNLVRELEGGIVIEVQEQNKKIMIGTTVKLLMGDNHKEITIGAYGESAPSQGLIAYASPLARAIAGMEVGEKKAAVIGGRTVDIEIEEIYPPSFRYNSLIAEHFGGDELRP